MDNLARLLLREGNLTASSANINEDEKGKRERERENSETTIECGQVPGKDGAEGDGGREGRASGSTEAAAEATEDNTNTSLAELHNRSDESWITQQRSIGSIQCTGGCWHRA